MTVYIHHAGTVAACLGALASVVFVASYLRVRWYGSEAGRMLMVLGTGMTVILAFVAARALSGTPVQGPGLETVRLVVYLYVAGIAAWLAWLERRTNKVPPADADADI